MKAELVISRNGKKSGRGGSRIPESLSYEQPSFVDNSSAESALMPEVAIHQNINDISKYWMYNWVLELKNLESWYERQSWTSKKKSGKGPLLSLVSFSGGKSHTMKKIREKSNDLLLKTVSATKNCMIRA